MQLGNPRRNEEIQIYYQNAFVVCDPRKRKPCAKMLRTLTDNIYRSPYCHDDDADDDDGNAYVVLLPCKHMCNTTFVPFSWSCIVWIKFSK